jgi:hypothetical protein
MYQVIPERVIRENAAELEASEPDNSFLTMLIAGNSFREALLTPIYLFNHQTKCVMVTSKEKLEKKFH